MNFKDLDRLQNRLNKVQRVKQPPTLRMLVVQVNENPPEPTELDEWTMCIQVEPKVTLEAAFAVCWRGASF